MGRFAGGMAAALLLLGSATGASAATIIQTDDEVVLRGFDAFDTRLGRLDKVTLGINVTKFRLWRVQTATPTTMSVDWAATGKWQLGSFNAAFASTLLPISGSGTADVTMQAIADGSGLGYLDVRLSGATTLALDAAQFIGRRNYFTGFDLGYFGSAPTDTVFTGPADVRYTQVPAGCSVRWNPGAEDLCGSARFTLTYDYTPPVPEPETWAMMLAGFATVGAALRRRRIALA